MNKWIKRSAIAAAVLVAGAAVAAVTLVQLGEKKLQRHIEIALPTVPYRDDAASIERGRYLFASRGCGDCHAKDGTGRVMIDDGPMFVRTPDITPAPQGAVAAYAPADWDRAIRHGVKRDGRPMMIMPSEDYNRFTDADLAAIVAYARQLAPGTGTRGEIRLPAPVRALYAVGAVQDASEKIDHTLPPSAPVAEAVSDAHGAYVANVCMGCHGPRLAGGKIPGAPPSWPPAAKIAPGAGSALDRYASAEQFMAMLKTGKRPDGSSISPVMPFTALKEMSEVDARALYLHLRSLAPT